MMAKMHEVLGWVSDFVEVTGYAAGTNTLTIADLCFTATISTLIASELIDNFDSRQNQCSYFHKFQLNNHFNDIYVLLDQKLKNFIYFRYPKITAYFDKMKGEIPNYDEVDGKGAQQFGAWSRGKIANGKR